MWAADGIKLGHSVLVVKYEDLKLDTLTQIKRMLKFLKVPYSHEELTKRLSGNYERFHRPHNDSVVFDHFTPEQRQVVMKTIIEVETLLKQRNVRISGIKQYMNYIL